MNLLNKKIALLVGLFSFYCVSGNEAQAMNKQNKQESALKDDSFVLIRKESITQKTPDELETDELRVSKTNFDTPSQNEELMQELVKKDGQITILPNALMEEKQKSTILQENIEKSQKKPTGSKLKKIFLIVPFVAVGYYLNALLQNSNTLHQNQPQSNQLTHFNPEFSHSQVNQEHFIGEELISIHGLTNISFKDGENNIQITQEEYLNQNSGDVQEKIKKAQQLAKKYLAQGNALYQNAWNSVSGWWRRSSDESVDDITKKINEVTLEEKSTTQKPHTPEEL